MATFVKVDENGKIIPAESDPEAVDVAVILSQADAEAGPGGGTHNIKTHSSGIQLTGEGAKLLERSMMKLRMNPNPDLDAKAAMEAADSPAGRERFVQTLTRRARENLEKDLADADPDNPAVKELKDAVNDKDAMEKIMNIMIDKNIALKRPGDGESPPMEGAPVQASGFFGGNVDAPADTAPAAKKPAGPKPYSFSKEMGAAFEHAFGPGATKRLNDQITKGNAALRPILDKDTGGILGMEVLVKKNGNFLHIDGVPKSQDAMLKIVINMSPLTMTLDGGRQAKVVDGTGAQVSRDRSKFVDNGHGSFVPAEKTPCETQAPQDRHTVLILADDGMNGGGKFAIGKYNGRADFDAVETRGNARVDLSGLQPTAKGQKTAQDLKRALARPEPAAPAAHPSSPAR